MRLGEAGETAKFWRQLPSAVAERPARCFPELYHEGVDISDPSLCADAATGVGKLLANHECWAGGIPGAGRTGASALLLEWLQSSDAEVRLAVVEALAGAESNTDDERAALERACLDSDEDVRDAAMEAIENATWQGSDLLGRELLGTLSAQSASAARLADAVVKGDVDAVRAVLAVAPAARDVADDKGRTALHRACA